MSTHGQTSRQLRPSFRHGRRSVPQSAIQETDPLLRPSFVRVSSERLRWLRSGVGAPGMPRSLRIMKRSSLIMFLPCLSGHTLRANSVALRHVAALLSRLLSQSKSGPLLQNARLGAWEPGPLPPQHAKTACPGPRHLAQASPMSDPANPGIHLRRLHHESHYAHRISRAGRQRPHRQ